MAEQDFNDSKDWTWVLERPCPECGFDSSSPDRDEIASLIRSNVADWLRVLERDTTELRRRPAPDRWSPLEYAHHVRDVFELYHVRLGLMLDTDDPTYPDWNQDETAVEKAYNSAAPLAVAAEVAEWGEALAARFDSVSGVTWDRPGTRSDGARFTVESFARYLIHDPIHHISDVNG